MFDKATSHTKAMLQKTEEEKRTLEKVNVGVSFTHREKPMAVRKGLSDCLFKSVH